MKMFPSLLALCPAALLAGTIPLAAQQSTTGTPGATPGGASGSAAPAQGSPDGAARSPAANFVLSRMIEMRPKEKRPLLLKTNERNPYARRSPEKKEVENKDEDPEEVEIRELLSSLSVTGRSRGANGLRLLLGDIIIERGRALPQLLEEQTERLEVVDVTPDRIVLGWIDADSGELTGKTMQMTYDLSPLVNYALHGQSREAGDTDDGESTQRRMGVIRPQGGSDERALRIADDKTEPEGESEPEGPPSQARARADR